MVRSGEAMERGLRDCCRSIRIGKILIQTSDDEGSPEVKVYYAKLPPNISKRMVLLMYPILGKFLDYRSRMHLTDPNFLCLSSFCFSFLLFHLVQFRLLCRRAV